MAGSYLGSDVGIVFVILGRRILHGKPGRGGVPSEARALLSVSTVHEGNEAVTSSLKQTSHVRVRVPAQQANLTRESKGPDLDLDRFGTAG